MIDCDTLTDAYWLRANPLVGTGGVEGMGVRARLTWEAPFEGQWMILDSS